MNATPRHALVLLCSLNNGFMASVAFVPCVGYIHQNGRFVKSTDAILQNPWHLSTRVHSSSGDAGRISVYQHDNRDDRFSGEIFSESKCWGRRPFVMRGAFDADILMGDHDDAAWPAWEDVVDIASDEESESRVISHKPGENDSFVLQWGPLSPDEADEWTFIEESTNDSALKRTLVVNDIDRFYPPLADWIHDNFKFIPNWRMDDGQISLAEEMGGIGPHVDNYDVFLIQMSGCRCWQVGHNVISAKSEIDMSIPDIDVRILDGWGVDAEYEEWILNPGDMLYLPPRVAHCGTALTNHCMTLSVGCRAPSVSDLVSRLAENFTSSLDDNIVRRYTDEDLLSSVNADEYSNGQLTNEAKHKARQLVLDSMKHVINDDEWWDDFFGKYVTEQKRVRINYPIPLTEQDEMISSEDMNAQDIPTETDIVQSVLSGSLILIHSEGIAFAYSYLPAKDSSHTIYRLFANGEMWQCKDFDATAATNRIARLYKCIADNRQIDNTLLLSCIGDDEQDSRYSYAVQLLQDLVRKGLLYELDSELGE